MRTSGLLALQAMFLLRVLGQVTATLVNPSWLPDPRHWYSGLLPYHFLLPIQVFLLMFMSLVTYDAWRGAGYWHVCRPGTKRILRVVAIADASAMVVRYIATMAVAPELRWTGHAIPVVFHVVLAAYIFVLSLPAHRSIAGSAVRPATAFFRNRRD